MDKLTLEAPSEDQYPIYEAFLVILTSLGAGRVNGSHTTRSDGFKMNIPIELVPGLCCFALKYDKRKLRWGRTFMPGIAVDNRGLPGLCTIRTLSDQVRDCTGGRRFSPYPVPHHRKKI